MPRFTLCAAIPLFDREPINPRCPDQPSAGRKPDGISRSSERHFDCCWSER
jgi:hypothetical protein